MKPKASMDDVLWLAFPAAFPLQTGALEIAVLAGLLVEKREQLGESELRLFGRLDRESVRLLESGLLAELPPTALLDLTHLDTVEPAALRSLIDRQRAEHRVGRQLLLRIAPHQVFELSSSDA